MEGPSSSSPMTSDVVQPKFLTPSDDEPGPSGLTGYSHRGNGEAKKLVLNMDEDCAAVHSDVFEEDSKPQPITREVIDGAISRRSKDRQVKMSIGNYDDFEDEAEETDEDRLKRFADGLRKIRQNKQEDFDFQPLQDKEMHQFVHEKVNLAMMFNHDNSTIQHLDFEPLGKSKTPKVVEGYLWGAVIGNGSYGKVKEVIDIYSLTRRAVKIMKYEKLRKITNGWENIRCEMSILRKLNHKNVIKLIEVFDISEKGKVYMVFEYCIGSVQQIIDLEPARRLTIGESHGIFVELCQGLSYLHSQRVSHKDIKPGNLLLSINWTVKICDFGVAEQISLYQEDGRCTKVNGTPKFQPPECVHGHQEFFDGYKADMWSAGITLYNLVSGRYPFERPVLLKLYECIGTEPLQMPTNVSLSPDLENLLTNLLEKDFNRRFDCLQAMSHPWFKTSFPEDQGLGRVMERMRTGNRPLTMFPSLVMLFDEPQSEYQLDDDGNEVFVGPLPLVCGGEIDAKTFDSFAYLPQTPQDAIPQTSSDDALLMENRRPSSRSMPTSAPPGVSFRASPTPVTDQHGAVQTQQNTDSETRPPRRRAKRGLFSCIFRSRTHSD